MITLKDCRSIQIKEEEMTKTSACLIILATIGVLVSRCMRPLVWALTSKKSCAAREKETEFRVGEIWVEQLAKSTTGRWNAVEIWLSFPLVVWASSRNSHKSKFGFQRQTTHVSVHIVEVGRGTKYP